MKTDTLHFVLRAEATQEEQWTWEALEDMCRAGDFSANDTIFLQDENEWVRIGDSALADLLPAGVDDDIDADREALEQEYRGALERIKTDPSATEFRMLAGRLACDLEDRDAAREHYQASLNLHPYDLRAKQEIKRHFSRNECATFQYLERPGTPWDDIGEWVAFPFTGEWYVIAAIAATLTVLSFIPFGWILASVIMCAWLFGMIRESATGSSSPPSWKTYAADPLRNLVIPIAVTGVSAALLGGILFGLARLTMLLDGNIQASVSQYAADSPILSVVSLVFAIAWLPAVMVSAANPNRNVLHALNPIFVGTSIARMKQEYIGMALVTLLLAGVVAGLHVSVGGIPVLGPLLVSASMCVAAALCAFLLGRLLGRNMHVL